MEEPIPIVVPDKELKKMVRAGLRQLDRWMEFDAWCKEQGRGIEEDPED